MNSGEEVCRLRERFYKIGEVSELLQIEQHTLRYLENSLQIRIKRDDRGDRVYTESDLDTLRLILKLKEKGLNTTAIKLALENTGEATEEKLTPAGNASAVYELVEIASTARKIVEQNEELLQKNKELEQRLQLIENKIDKIKVEREKKIDEFLELWRNEQKTRNKSWFSIFKKK